MQEHVNKGSLARVERMLAAPCTPPAPARRAAPRACAITQRPRARKSRLTPFAKCIMHSIAYGKGYSRNASATLHFVKENV